jgi:LEA14-like dessication related protein
MTLTQRSRIIVVVTLALVLTPTAGASEAAKPKISFKGLSVRRVDVDKKTVELRVKVDVNNPGPGFKLKDLRYRVKLNAEDAAAGRAEKRLEIAAESTSSLELPLMVRLKSLPLITWTTVTDGFTVKYEVQIEGTVPVFASLTHKLRVESNGELSLSEAIADCYARMRNRLTVH